MTLAVGRGIRAPNSGETTTDPKQKVEIQLVRRLISRSRLTFPAEQTVTSHEKTLCVHGCSL